MGEVAPRGQAMNCPPPRHPQLSRMGKTGKSSGWNNAGSWKFCLALGLSPDPALSHWATSGKRVLL